MTDMRTAPKRRRYAPAVAVALSLAFVWADTPWAQTAQGRVIYMAAGEFTRVTFTAAKPGLYPITCTKHTPSMQGTLVVLPK